MESKVEITTEGQKDSTFQPSDDIEAKVKPIKKEVSMPTIPINKILYYTDHPELEPPITIKNMVNLQRMMAENPIDTDSDSSSDIFYSSDEEEEEKEDLGEYYAKLSIGSKGIRFPNAYISNKILKDIDYAYVENKQLYISRHKGDIFSIVLSDSFDGNIALSALEKWIVNYR